MFLINNKPLFFLKPLFCLSLLSQECLFLFDDAKLRTFRNSQKHFHEIYSILCVLLIPVNYCYRTPFICSIDVLFLADL